LPAAERRIANPKFTPGLWCGVTYKAYLDFVLARDDLSYYTVDTDYGCGVIRKLADDHHPPAPPAGPEHRDPIERWQRMGGDFESSFKYFKQNQHHLLKLRSSAEFFQVEARG
jgi:hypothetical protein